MAKKSSLLGFVVAIVGFAIPATAKAGPLVTSSAGVPAKAGQVFTATAMDMTLTSSIIGTTTCLLDFSGSLTKNNGVEFEATGKTFLNPNCKNGSNVVTLTSVEVSKLFSNASNKVSLSFVVTVDIGEIFCKYTGTNLSGTYVSGSDTIVFTKATGVTGSPVACGTAAFDSEFKLEIGKTPVILD